MKFIKTTLLLLIILCTLSTSFAINLITLDDYQTVDVVFNGDRLDSSASAKLVDGNLMLPMRTYFEILGASIKWVGSTREVISYKNNNFIKIKIDSEMASRNGKDFELLSKPQLINGSTYIPARFIADTFDLNYKYSKSKNTLSLDVAKQSTKFNFIRDDYFKRIPFDDIGVYISVPQLWTKSDESNTIYEYIEGDTNYTLEISSNTLAEDQTIEDYINQIKKSEFDLYSTDITYTGSYEDTINQIDTKVVSSIIKDKTKEIRFFLEEGDTIYTIKFDYSIETPETEAIDTINLIAKSFQISNFTINYNDEHYIEYDAMYNNQIVLDQDIFSNMEIKGMINFSGSLSKDSSISALKLTVSKSDKSKSFLIAIHDGKFDGKLYAPFELGKHNIKLEAVWKDQDELIESEINKNHTNSSLSAQLTLSDIDTINEKAKMLNQVNPKIMEFSLINLEIKDLEFLVPSEKVQKDDIEISSLSNLLTYENVRKFDKAKSIFSWTSENISLRQGSNFDNPKDSIAVFDDEYGNSLEINLLYTALLRSIDIPSKIILASNSEGSSYYYTEIYLNGEWSTSDIVAAIRDKDSDTNSSLNYFLSSSDNFIKNFDETLILKY